MAERFAPKRSELNSADLPGTRRSRSSELAAAASKNFQPSRRRTFASRWRAR